MEEERQKVKKILNDILSNKESTTPVETLSKDMSLTTDLGLDSLDLAEMTVRLEEQYGVDVFADDVIDEVDEVLEKLEQ